MPVPQISQESSSSPHTNRNGRTRLPESEPKVHIHQHRGHGFETKSN